MLQSDLITPLSPAVEVKSFMQLYQFHNIMWLSNDIDARPGDMNITMMIVYAAPHLDGRRKSSSCG